MCGRTTKNYTWEQIHAMHQLIRPAAIPNMQPSFNVCPTDPVDVVVEGPDRIYMVEPTGQIEDDPNLSDKKFPGNPTKSFRSRNPLRVTGEVTDWQGHSPEELKAMKDNLERLKRLGVEAIED
jgi:hypothetical protein